MSDKTMVLDTNVLLHDPEAMFAFGKNEVVIPFIVLCEIDEQKKRQDEIGRNARKVNKNLDEIRTQGNLSGGVRVNGGIIRVELNNLASKDLPKNLPTLNMNKADNRILAVAVNLQQRKGKGREPTKNVILISKDLNLRVRADACGVKVEDYNRDRIDYSELYSGVSNIQLTDSQIKEFENRGTIAVNEKIYAFPNQFFIHRNGLEDSLILRYEDGLLVPLEYEKETNWGLSPLNIEQIMAQELLMNPDIPVISIVGPAGTGKTLISIAVGMEAVVEKGQYKKLVVTRPIVPMGKDLGYLPGNKEEKIDPWMQPIYDNLGYLMRDCEFPDREINLLKDNKALEVEVLTYIRGRSIPMQFIICDEAQNMTPLMIKTLVTRVGKGTKIVFTGDPSQIDTPYLDASSNGLSYLVDRLKGEKISGHITLVKSERSEVAEICSRAL